jgi:hypothetical protein
MDEECTTASFALKKSSNSSQRLTPTGRSR